MNNNPDIRCATRVGIAFNMKTDPTLQEQAEFDEPETIAAIDHALKAAGFETILLEASEDFPQKVYSTNPDIVFNIAEGKSGRNREAQVPAILEYYNIPYTGSDAATLSISLDKALTKQIVEGCGIETPTSFAVKDGVLKAAEDILFPVLIKPNTEGSSKGISDTCVAEDLSTLQALIDGMMRDYAQDILLERYIDGREFTVGLLGNGPDTVVFEPMEIVYQKSRGSYKIYSYEVKKNYKEYISYQCPPDISQALKIQMMDAAKTIYETLRCVDFARVDFRLSTDEKLFFIEINPLPGLAPGYSDYIMLAEYNGITYNALINEILHSSLKRFGMKAVGKK